MSENNHQEAQEILKQWLHNQHQYYQAWANIGADKSVQDENAEPVSHADFQKWHQDLVRWWNLSESNSQYASQTDDDVQRYDSQNSSKDEGITYKDNVFSKVSGVAQHFLQFTEDLFKAQKNAKNDSIESEQQDGEIFLESLIRDWLDNSLHHMGNWVEQLKQLLLQDDLSIDEMIKCEGDWIQSGLSMYRRLYQVTHQMPDGETAAEHFLNLIKIIQSISKFQLEPNKQQHLQQMLPAFNRYRRANIAYVLILANNGLLAGEIFKEQMDASHNDCENADLALEGQNESPQNMQAKHGNGEEVEINSLQELYHYWLEINQTVYVHSAMSEEYQCAYAELLNSHMFFKQLMERYFVRQVGPLNLCLGRQMDSLLISQKQLKNENQNLRHTLDELLMRMDAMEKKTE